MSWERKQERWELERKIGQKAYDVVEDWFVKKCHEGTCTEKRGYWREYIFHPEYGNFPIAIHQETSDYNPDYKKCKMNHTKLAPEFHEMAERAKYLVTNGKQGIYGKTCYDERICGIKELDELKNLMSKKY